MTSQCNVSLLVFLLLAPVSSVGYALDARYHPQIISLMVDQVKSLRTKKRVKAVVVSSDKRQFGVEVCCFRGNP